MGLDVYVGSLSRYYAGEWETIVQQTGRQQGLTVQIVRPQPRNFLARLKAVVGGLHPTGPEAAQKAVNRWRQTLGAASGLGERFVWNENTECEYFTAAYDLLPNAKRAAASTEGTTTPRFRLRGS